MADSIKTLNTQERQLTQNNDQDKKQEGFIIMVAYTET